MEAPSWITELIDEQGVEEASRDYRFERWLDQRPDLVLEALRASTWINSVRQPQEGPLDIEATTTIIGIPVLYDLENGDGQIIGLGEEPGLPLLIRLQPNENRTVGEQRLGFAHEVGRYFIEKVADYHTHRKGHENDIERLVEHFGREMVVPSHQLEGVGEVDKQVLEDLQNAYGADLQTVIYQLMVAGKLPPKVAIDTNIPSWRPNKELAGTVERRHICLACEFTDGECIVTHGVPAFDFTETELLGDILKAHVVENYDPQATKRWFEEFTGKSWEDLVGKNWGEL